MFLVFDLRASRSFLTNALDLVEFAQFSTSGQFGQLQPKIISYLSRAFANINSIKWIIMIVIIVIFVDALNSPANNFVGVVEFELQVFWQFFVRRSIFSNHIYSILYRLRYIAQILYQFSMADVIMAMEFNMQSRDRGNWMAHFLLIRIRAVNWPDW